MLAIVKDLKNYTRDSAGNWTTEEKIVGTWINGKPVYQKTVILSTPIAGGWMNGWKNDIAFVADNIEFLVKAISYATAVNLGKTDFVGISANGYYSVYHLPGYNVSHLGVTFQYTKSID